jgi:hypothetical protein
MQNNNIRFILVLIFILFGQSIQVNNDTFEKIEDDGGGGGGVLLL